MNDADSSNIIAQTKKWITDTVVGCNFCPFAAKELRNETIHYRVLADATVATALETVLMVLQQLDDDDAIETSFVILPGSFHDFDAYLDLVALTERLLLKENYEGVYQVASFHPHYLFAGSMDDAASNYTNRSPYAMLHFLREDSVSKVVNSYAGVHEVPLRNIAFTNEKGLLYMQQLLKGAFSGLA